jgi:transcriptional regulator with XRE-family HTH domain
LALELERRMEAQHLTIKDVASQAKLTYEHVRKLAHGEALPSIQALERICKVLHADLHEMTTLLFAEKAFRTYGSHTVVDMTGANKELAPIEVNWPHLDAEQKAVLIDVAQAMARRNAMKSSAVDVTFSAKKEPKR